MDKKLFYFEPEKFFSWLLDVTLCNELQHLREENYRKLLRENNLVLDKYLNNFFDFDIDLNKYNYKRSYNKFENLELGIWKSNLNLAYTLSKTVGDIINSQILNDFSNNIDLFVKTFWNDSLVLFVPNNTYVKNSISLLNCKDSFLEFNQLLIKKVIVIVGENSRIELVENNLDYNNNLLIESISIIAKSNSIVKFSKNNNVNGYNIININCYADRNAVIDILDCPHNGRFNLSYINLNLIGPGAESNYVNLSYVNSASKAIITNQIHRARYTKSRVISKSLLKDKAQYFYKGLININRNAYNSDSDQKNLNLILDDDVKVCSIPSIEVENHDVKCSHGSAMDKINKDQLWYLNSRGLELDQANRFIIEGFFRDVNISSFKEPIDKLIKYLI